MQNVTINISQNLFVIGFDGGYSCLGFDVVQRRIDVVSKWLSDNGVKINAAQYDHGTLGQYAAYADIMKRGAEFNAKTGKRCDAYLIPEFIGKEGRRVECTMDGERVRFRIGKSTGWIPTHLAIKARSSGGFAISRSDVTSIKFI